MSAPSDLPLHDAHVAAGARFGERRGRAVVASYGDLATEHSTLLAGAGLVDLPARAILEVSGPTRLKFLQGMLTNDVAGRLPGQGCLTAMLSARGAVQALARALVERDVVLLETDADRVGPLQTALEHYRVAAPVRFSPRPTVVVALVGPEAEAVLRKAGVGAPGPAAESHAVVSLGSTTVRLSRAGDLPGGGFVLHLPRDTPLPAWDALLAAGARPAGLDALDVRRVETIEPWWGDDVTEDNLLHETGLVARYTSFTKGCYVGQETMARLDARGGHVSRALRGLRLANPVAPGTTVRAAGAEAGHVTSAVVSPRLGPLALAYVHRNHFAPGTSVGVGGVAGTVVASFEAAAASSESLP